MANFCKYCGKALSEGEICTCPQAVAEQTPASPGQTQVVSPQTTEMINGFLANLKTLILSPAKGARQIVDNSNPVISLILMAVQAVLAGIISLEYTAFHLEMDFGDCMKYFVLSIFFSILLTGITLGCSILVSVCMKGNNDIKKVLNALSLRCIAIIPFTVLAVPLTFLLPSFALGMIFVCEIIGLFYEYFGFLAAFGLEEGKTAYISIIVSIVYIIVFMVIFRSVASNLIQTLFYSMFRSSYY